MYLQLFYLSMSLCVWLITNNFVFKVQRYEIFLKQPKINKRRVITKTITKTKEGGGWKEDG